MEIAQIDHFLIVDGAKPDDVAPVVRVGLIRGKLDAHFVVLP